MKYTLALNRCPHGVEMISIDDSNGGGTNLTGNKCCGRWSVVKEWYMPHRLLVGAILELEEAAALSAKATDGAREEKR